MKRFQNKVAGSRFSLPMASIYAALVWLAAGLVAQQMWAPFLLVALSTYLMAEINNRNALIRIRSRMVSCTFLVLTMMGVSIGIGGQEAGVQLALVGFLLAIFHAYQDEGAVGAIFFAFLLIGISSIVFVQMLWFVPLLAILVSRPLYAMSWKGMSAILLGVMLPYWVFIPYLIYIGDYQLVLAHFSSIIDTSLLFDYSQLTVGILTEYVLLIILAVIGWMHFIRTAFKDKIRTRMFINVFIAISLVMMIVIPIVPAYANYFLPLMIVGVSPLVAHFVTLTETRLSNYTFIAMIVIVLAITAIGLTTDWLQTPLGLNKIHIVIE